LRVRIQGAERGVIANRGVRARRVVAGFVDPFSRRHLPLGGRELLGCEIGIRRSVAERLAEGDAHC
jgi:hypothetical protein